MTAYPKVKVLGALEVDGLERRFPLRKCLELVTYLTFHRNGVEADTLMEALWPDQPPNYPRLNVHTSRARSTMGHDPAGQPYLPYIDDTVYKISLDLDAASSASLRWGMTAFVELDTATQPETSSGTGLE